MPNRLRTLLALAGLLSASSIRIADAQDNPKASTLARPRTWSDSTGAFKLKAILVEVTGETVTLRKGDGQEVQVPISRLSQQDQALLREHASTSSAATFNLPGGLTLPEPGPASLLRELTGTSGKLVSEPLPADAQAAPILAVTPLAELKPDPVPAIPAFRPHAVPISPIDPYDKVGKPMTIDPKGVFAISVGRNVAGRQDTRGRLFRFNLTDRKAEPLLDLSESVDLVAHDLRSGQSLLVVGRDNLYRGGELVLVDGVLAGTIKPICRRSLPGIDQPGFKPNVEWASLRDGIALINLGSSLHAWNLAENRAAYQLPMAAGEKCAVSPGGQYLAIGQSQKVVFIDARSGEVLGSFPTGTSLIPQLVFDPSGTRLALAMGSQLAVWNLQDASFEQELTLVSPVGDIVGWVEPRLILTTLAGLIDLDLQMGVWRYNLNYAQRADAIQGGIVNCDEMSQFLVAQSLGVPHPAATKMRTRLARGGAKDLIVEPGTAVAVRVETTQPVDTQAITDAIRQAAQRAGWKVQPRAPIELVALIGRGETQTLNYRKGIGPSTTEESAMITPFTSELQIRRGDNTLWTSRTSNHVPFTLFLKDGETLQQAVSKFERPDADFFQRIQLPPRIVNTAIMSEIGLSRVNQGAWVD
jgi:hypothetical protein